MKLAFTPILLAGLELALLANVGNAYFSYSSDSDVAARDLGYELSDVSFARSIYVPEISEISTRALVEELEDRLTRRDKVAELEAKLAAGGLSKKETKKLQKKLKKAKKKAAKAATAGAEPVEAEPAGEPQPEPDAAV
ncbi:hypothetical protein BJ165DRAFT_1521576 [Panaeolus papilionaceus]|nr:hypothetical protein BJ165DRAFT_1521576 [Panaeolus papilionaceus]